MRRSWNHRPPARPPPQQGLQHLSALRGPFGNTSLGKTGGQNNRGPGVLAASTLVVHRLELDWDVREGPSGPRRAASAAGGAAALRDARVAAPSAPHPGRDGDELRALTNCWKSPAGLAPHHRLSQTQLLTRSSGHGKARGPALCIARSSPCGSRAAPVSAEAW